MSDMEARLPPMQVSAPSQTVRPAGSSDGQRSAPVTSLEGGPQQAMAGARVPPRLARAPSSNRATEGVQGSNLATAPGAMLASRLPGGTTQVDGQAVGSAVGSTVVKAPSQRLPPRQNNRKVIDDIPQQAQTPFSPITFPGDDTVSRRTSFDYEIDVTECEPPPPTHDAECVYAQHILVPGRVGASSRQRTVGIISPSGITQSAPASLTMSGRDRRESDSVRTRTTQVPVTHDYEVKGLRRQRTLFLVCMAIISFVMFVLFPLALAAQTWGSVFMCIMVLVMTTLVCCGCYGAIARNPGALQCYFFSGMICWVCWAVMVVIVIIFAVLLFVLEEWLLACLNTILIFVIFLLMMLLSGSMKTSKDLSEKCFIHIKTQTPQFNTSDVLPQFRMSVGFHGGRPSRDVTFVLNEFNFQGGPEEGNNENSPQERSAGEAIPSAGAASEVNLEAENAWRPSSGRVTPVDQNARAAAEAAHDLEEQLQGMDVVDMTDVQLASTGIAVDALHPSHSMAISHGAVETAEGSQGLDSPRTHVSQPSGPNTPRDMPA